jgi:hypothetical protein
MKATGSYMFAKTAALAALGSLALITACETRMPTAAEVADMDVAAVEKTAVRFEVAGVNSGDVIYEVDGQVVTAEEARAIAPDAIATVDVRKDAASGHARISIRTSASGSAAVTGGEERVIVIRSPSGGEASGDSTARVVIRRNSGGEERSGGVHLISPGASGADPAILFIDGVRVDPARMRTLRPEQIEKIEVIKGEAAVARFGDPDAAKGVIRITTKPAAAPGS